MLQLYFLFILISLNHNLLPWGRERTSDDVTSLAWDIMKIGLLGPYNMQVRGFGAIPRRVGPTQHSQHDVIAYKWHHYIWVGMLWVVGLCLPKAPFKGKFQGQCHRTQNLTVATLHLPLLQDLNLAGGGRGGPLITAVGYGASPANQLASAREKPLRSKDPLPPPGGWKH